MRRLQLHANLAGERRRPLGDGASAEVSGIEEVVNGRFDRETTAERLGNGATRLVLSERRLRWGSPDLVEAGGRRWGGATETVEGVGRLRGDATGMGEVGGGSEVSRPKRLGWREARGWFGQIGRRVREAVGRVSILGGWRRRLARVRTSWANGSGGSWLMRPLWLPGRRLWLLARPFWLPAGRPGCGRRPFSDFPRAVSLPRFLPRLPLPQVSPSSP